MEGAVSIIIPAKNEEDSLGLIIQEIKELYPDYEVIVVNDGSSDETENIAKSFGVRVISHRYSKGNGAAVKSGAREASGDVLVFLDGDGQHNPKDIGRLIEKLNEGYDLVVGARSRESQASAGRAIANGVYNRLATYMTGQTVSDLTSGYRAFNAKKFKEFLYLLPNGFSYPTTSTMAFFRAGYSVAYIPICAASRKGKSHIKPMKDGLRFLIIIFKVGTLYSPLKLFFPLSISLLFTGISYYLFTYITSGRFTNMSALLFTTSLVIFMMGLVSEQITALSYKDK